MKSLAAALVLSSAVLSAVCGPAIAADTKFDLVCPLYDNGELLTKRVYSIDTNLMKLCMRNVDGGCLFVKPFHINGATWTLVDSLKHDKFDFHAEYDPDTETLTETSVLDGKRLSKIMAHCTRHMMTPLPQQQ